MSCLDLNLFWPLAHHIHLVIFNTHAAIECSQVCIWSDTRSPTRRLACYASRTHWIPPHGNYCSFLNLYVTCYHKISQFEHLHKLAQCSSDWCWYIDLQPHGFFNSSPAVDVPPSSMTDSELKENGLVDKSCHTGLVAKMWKEVYYHVNVLH